MKNAAKYSAAWKDTIRPAVLRRDGYKCTVCKAPQRSVGYYNESDHFIVCDQFMVDWAHRQRIKLTTVHLQVAHLDQDPSNNSLVNLRTFCPRHHLAYDREYHRFKRGANKLKQTG